MFSHPTHLTGDLLSKLQFALLESGYLSSQESYDVFNEGVGCGFLEMGSAQWQSGKIRVCLEFIPDKKEVSKNLIEPGISIEFAPNQIQQTLNGAN